MLNGRVGQVIGPFNANEDLLETNGAIGTFTPETTKPILYKLGIQAPEGTRVQINEAVIQIGKTGIYELDNVVDVKKLIFLDSTDDSAIVDFVY